MTALGVLGRVIEFGVVAASAAVLAGRARAVRASAGVPRASASIDDVPKIDVGSITLKRRTPEGVVTVDARDGVVNDDLLTAFLADVSTALGADEAVLWRSEPGRAGTNGETPLAWAASSTGRAPSADYATEVVPLARWSATERMTHFGGGTVSPTLAVAPVTMRGGRTAALSFYRADGLAAEREPWRRWLPRCAAHLAQLVELLDTREEFLRQTQQQKALLSAAHEFQQNRSIEALGRSICETAVRVTGAKRAALVRWYAEREGGEVQSVSPADDGLVGVELTSGSHVSQMCISGLPQVWENASNFDKTTPVFGLGEPLQHFGSLAIVPLKRDRGVTGAIVIEGAKRGDVRIKDVRNVHLLAAMAAVSLETLWEIEEVTRRARTDQLTGLPNRRAFDESLANALVLAERYVHPLSLIMVDIDHFKRVNDTYGHAAGDQVLRAVAATLQRMVRTTDLCARFGGEEIAVLLPHTPQGGAEELAERLRAAVAAKPVRVGGREIDVTVSIGVACYRDSVASTDGLFAGADRALYRAKADGRNCVRSSAVIAD